MHYDKRANMKTFNADFHCDQLNYCVNSHLLTILFRFKTTEIIFSLNAVGILLKQFGSRKSTKDFPKDFSVYLTGS